MINVSCTGNSVIIGYRLVNVHSYLSQEKTMVEVN